MTELYIAGQKVILDKSMSLTLVEENPFFTKSGSYTLDLVLSLEAPANAKIYENINRYNKADEIEDKRSAILIVDNEVVLNGIEKILGWSDISVTIQLMSGNSELNFLVGGDRKLRDLDLGSAVPFVAPVVLGEAPYVSLGKVIFQSWKLSYPERDWHLLPYYTGEPQGDYDPSYGETILYPSGNLISFYPYNPDNLPGDDTRDAIFNGAYSGQVPQPYFCFIVNEILKSLGYTLTYNAIALHEVLKNAYIVHGYQTMEFSKMLPSWTVSEFLSKIELQFDCTFIIDKENRTIRLLFNYQKYAENEITTLNVIDEYETEVDDDNVLDVRAANIGYSLDSDDYYKYMDINPLFRKMAQTEYYSELSTLWLIITKRDDENKFKKIYVDIDTNDKFIAYDTGKIVDGKPHIIPRRVDSFCPIYNNPASDEIDLQFDIIPASMIIEKRDPFPRKGWIWTQMATAGGFDELHESTPEFEDPMENFDLQSLIEGDTSLEEDSSYSKMRLAIYPGLTTLDNTQHSRYPISYVESLCEYFEETGIERYFGTKGANPFRLANLNKDIYSKSKNIDTTLIYNRTFLNYEKINVGAKFIIKNKSFVCKQIERTVTIDGFDEAVEGEFYPINE